MSSFDRDLRVSGRGDTSMRRRFLIGTYRSNILSRTNYVGQVPYNPLQPASSSGSAFGGSGSPTGLPPYLAVIVLVSGVLGGLLFVISTIVFCKYCVHGEDSCVTRLKTFFMRRSTSDPHQHKYESLNLQCSKPVCCSPGGATETCRHYSSSSNLSSVKPSTIEVSLFHGEQDDGDEEIDTLVAEYRESLYDELRHSTLANSSSFTVQDESSHSQQQTQQQQPQQLQVQVVVGIPSRSTVSDSVDDAIVSAPDPSVSSSLAPSLSTSTRCRLGGSLLNGPAAMKLWASTASDGVTATGTVTSGSDALGPTSSWHSDRHVSFVLGSEKAGSFGGYGEVTSSPSSSAYHRCTEGDYHHLKHTKIDRSPAVAKQRSLGSLSGSNLPSSYQQHRFHASAATAAHPSSIGTGSSSLTSRGQANSVDSELPPHPHGTATVNGEYGSSTKSLTGNSSVVRRDSGNNRLPPLNGRSASVTSGITKSLRMGFTENASISSSSVDGGDLIGKTSSSTSTIVMISASSTAMVTSGAMKSLSSSTRSTSAAAAVSSSGRKNTLDVPYGQPETRYDGSKRRQSMSLEIVPPPEKRPSPLSQRRVKSYDDSAAEMHDRGPAVEDRGPAAEMHDRGPAVEDRGLAAEMHDRGPAVEDRGLAAEMHDRGPAVEDRGLAAEMHDRGPAVEDRGLAAEMHDRGPAVEDRGLAAEMHDRGDRDYDRHRITQFIRQPFSTSAAGDDDGLTSILADRSTLVGGGVATATSGGGADKLKTRARNTLPVSVRYNDTGSFEEVDEEKVELLLSRSSILNPTQRPSPVNVISCPPEGVSHSVYVQSRELWRLRASLAETESFSDIVRMDDIASSPEVLTSSLTTSFESNEVASNRRDPQDAIVGSEKIQQLDQYHQHQHNQQQQQQPPPHAQQQQQQVHNQMVHCTPRYARSPAASLLLSGESRRQAYRRAIAQRWSAKSDAVQPATFGVVTGGTGGTGPASGAPVGRQVAPPPSETSFDSIDTMETDGDVSDTSCSRPEITTTSFDSTTTTTTTTTDNNTDDVDGQGGHQLQLQYDSGYKSIEVRPWSAGELTAGGSVAPAQPTPHDDLTAVETDSSTVTSRRSATSDDCCSTPSRGGAGCTSTNVATSSSPLIPSAFERRSVKTASKKRRQYRSSAGERRVQVYESINEMLAVPDSLTPSSSVAGPQSNAMPTVVTSSIGAPRSDAVFQTTLQSNRWLRYRLHGHSVSMSSAGGVPHRRSSSPRYSDIGGLVRRRDYSVDKQTDAVYNEFLRYDPRLEEYGAQLPLQRHSSLMASRQNIRHFTVGDGESEVAGGSGSPSALFCSARGRRILPSHISDGGVRCGSSFRRRSPHTVVPLSPPPEEDDGQITGSVAGIQMIQTSGMGLQRSGVTSMSGLLGAGRVPPRRCSSADGGCSSAGGYGGARDPVSSAAAAAAASSCGVTIYRHHATLVDGTSASSVRLQYLDDTGSSKS